MKQKETVVYTTKKRSMMQESMHRLVKNKTAMAGLIVLLIVITLCALAGFICPEGYDKQDIMNKFISPCAE